MLGEQYLVTFEAPDELPAVAEVVFQSGDQEYRTVVDLPDADTEEAAPTEGSRSFGAGGIAGLVSLVVAGLLLIGRAVFALVRRTRWQASVSSAPAAAAAHPQATPSAPAPAMPATEKGGGDPPSDGAPSSTPATALATSALQPRPRRGSLSAAVQGRRSAEQALNSAPEQQVRHPPEDKQPQPVPAGNQAQSNAPEAGPRPAAANASAETAQPTPQSDAGPQIAAPGSAAQNHHPREVGYTATTVLTGSGDAVVELTRTSWSPAVVYISGNSDSQYFAVRTLGTNNVLVMTMEPYDGIRPLDWDGDESSGFEIWATGPWRIEVLPLSAIPTFTDSFNGNGNMVVHYNGTGSRVRITGNNEGQHLEVRALSTYGPYRRLVDTTRPYTGECQISRRPQIFEVQATGSWTITVI
jgi:hypothetical protein